MGKLNTIFVSQAVMDTFNTMVVSYVLSTLPLDAIGRLVVLSSISIKL